ncbi:5-fold beta-flower protein [Chitinophaga sp. Cy-1792]|uniref:5-fold beta-flower protein n=1 Tax=Chitinophaga sp. Cy-1792 TaxID=2608339 RepID=UPI001422C33B|nr:hypothetical protein [Chitinophaga sp. Cy-1792]NIG56532.1 hypothetical protein [Chitinophaga sp. Cy-1792]
MKKMFLLFAVLLCGMLSKAQTIKSHDYTSRYSVNSDGVIRNSGGSTAGYIKSDGRVENAGHETIGYVKGDRVTDKGYSTIGYIKSDGKIQNSGYETLGYIKADGKVLDRNYSTLGYASGVKREWAALIFFFFDF